MSAIERETSEYVEMSDSITLCIVKDGTAGTSINMKTGVSSPDALPSSGASIGDSYIIDGHLWTYTGGTASDATHRNGFTDCGKVSGEAGKNNYVHVAWSNKQKNHTIDDIVLSNTDSNAYAYMGTWVSETKEDTADEAVKMAKWVYVKGDKGDTPTFAKLRVNHSALHYNPSTGKWDYDSVTVTIVIFTPNGTQIPDYGDTKEYYWLLDNDTTKRSSGMGFSATLKAASRRATLYKDGSNVAIDTITVPMVRDGKQGVDGSAATVYTIETVGNNNNSGTLEDASTILVTLDGNLKLYKTVGSEKTEDSRPPQCWRLTLGGTNLDDVPVFDNSAGNNIVSYGYSKDYKIDSNGNSAVPGSATISVYKDSSMSELLASLVIPITLNPGAIVNVDAKLGKIESTTTSMKDDMNGMKGTIETIQQGQGQISLKVQDLQNGGVDTSKPHTSSQVDFRTLDADSFYPVMIWFKDDGGVRHTVEISRNLDGTYGSGKDYMTHSQGFSFRLIFSDIANGWGTNEEGQLHIESISQRWTEPTDTPICPKIAQYYPFSFTLAWLRGGSKYDITVDCADAYISGIWPYMMQVASNPSWVPDAVRLAPDTWTTAQVNAQGGNPYNMLRKDNGGYYADVDNEYLYRFGELAAGNTFAIVGQPRDSKVWFLATWHITSVSGSKVYVDVSTYGLLWQAQNPLGIRMSELGYIKTGASYPKSTWDSQNGFGTSEDVDNTAVHADWAVPRAILVIGKESSATNGVYRDRAVLEAVQSCTEGSSVSFYGNTYFDVSPLYGTDGRTNVKPDLLATGIDIKSHKIVATADNFVVRNNSGDMTFSIDKEGNIVGKGNASFKGSVTATKFSLTSDKFCVDDKGLFKLNMTNFSVDEEGNITATGGRISFFTFTDSGMYSTSSSSQWGLGLRSANISVRGTPGGRTSLVCLGDGHRDTTGGDANTYPKSLVNYQDVNYCNLIQVTGGGSGNGRDAAALGIETDGDFCLSAMGGLSHLQGLALDASTTTNGSSPNRTLFLCSGGHFTMPSNPKDGQLVIVIQTRDRIDFNGNGHRFQSGTYNSLSFTSDSAGQWSLFYYNNGVWYTIYMTR